MRVVITFTLVPVVAAAVVVGLFSITDDSTGLLFPGVALATATISYQLLRRADAPRGWAISGALAGTVLWYALALAILVEYFVH